ncbi:hypothetical protein TNCV_3259181 [Trichonephila clavipes]|nr:hypothetical protein TNCV_3259181 [Trichonephila clavipes]
MKFHASWTCVNTWTVSAGCVRCWSCHPMISHTWSIGNRFSALAGQDSVAIEVSSRLKLTGIVRGKAFLHVLRRRSLGYPESRKRTR